MSKPNTFLYEVAPPGSPDKFRLTEDAHSVWKNPPRWIFVIVARRGVRLDNGYVVAYYENGWRMLHCCISKGFYFSVSAAPDFKRALGPAAFHDFLYENSEALAAAWGVPVRTVLHIADHWFLALMRFTGFALKRTYFCAVRVLGFWFHNLFKKDRQ